MTKLFFELLRCPSSGGKLNLLDAVECDGRVKTGLLISDEGQAYSIIDGIPRFVARENYANNFGFQWNKFRETQLDRHTKVPISRHRFFISTEWEPEALRGKKVLEVGCGAGRFTEILLSSGATVVSCDYSNAVDACAKNHRDSSNLHIVQADIYRLPFDPGQFDFVFCFGVLQHTPDVKRALMALIPQLKRGGRLAVDVYRKRWGTIFWSKYWIRPITKRIETMHLFQLIEKWVPRLLPLSIAIGRLPLIGRKARYLVPVANYDGIFPLSRAQLEEWAILDTFDMLAPQYDAPQTEATLTSWLHEAGLTDIKVFHPAHLVGLGRKL